MKTILLSLAILIAIGMSAQTPATIYEIQGQTDVSPLSDQIIETSGIVTAMNRDDGFFMQDGTTGWNGLLVYGEENTWGVSLGDEVTVIGKVTEYFEMTELVDVVTVTIVTSGNTVPSPITLTTGTYGEEQYEGMLINCVDIECTDIDQDYGEVLFNDGSGDLRMDDGLYSYWNDGDLVEGTTYQLTGIVVYSYDQWKVLPRDASDLVEGELGIYDNEINGLEIYPNPVSNDVVYISAKARLNSINVYNMVGQNVKRINAINNTQVAIDMSELKQGMYILTIESNNGDSNTHKITVK